MPFVYGPDGVLKKSDGTYTSDVRTGNAIYFSPSVAGVQERAASEKARQGRVAVARAIPYQQSSNDAWVAARQEAERLVREQLDRDLAQARTNARLAAAQGSRVLDPWTNPGFDWQPGANTAELNTTGVNLFDRPEFDAGPGRVPDLPGMPTATRLSAQGADSDPAVAPARKAGSGVKAGAQGVADQMAAARVRDEDHGGLGADAQVIRDYNDRLERWLQVENQHAYDGIDDDSAGFGTGDQPASQLNFPNLSGRAPDFILNMDQNTGRLTIEGPGTVFRSVVSTLMSSPAEAAKWQTLLAQTGAYVRGSEQYVPKAGRFGNWTDEDNEALELALKQVAIRQANGDTRSWQEIIASKAAVGLDAGTSPPAGAQGASGGGYGGGGYGGGGGGYGGGGGQSKGVTLTDSAELKQLANGVARARMGRVLSEDETAQFVAYYHAAETAFINARIAGQTAEQKDPESQAADWLESHFKIQSQNKQEGSLTVELVKFLMGGGLN